MENNQEIERFYINAAKGIRIFLMQHTGLIHNDKESKLLAEYQGIKQRGIYDIVGFRDNPRVLVIQIKTAAGNFKLFSNNKTEISIAAGLNGNQTANISRGNKGSILIELPKPKNLIWNVPGPKLATEKDSYAVCIGLDMEGNPVIFDFSNHTFSHLFISGMTGSGKTILEKMILVQLARQNGLDRIRFILSDVGKQGRNFNDISDLPLGNKKHLLYSVLTTIEETRAAFLLLNQEMQKRMKLSREELNKVPRWVFAIDEVQEVLKDSICIEFAEKIAAKGREFKISLLLATQFTNSDYLENVQVLKNCASIVGKCRDSREAFNMTGVKGSGAETLTGAGDFMIIQDGHSTRFQVGILTPSMVRALPIQWAEFPNLPGIIEELEESNISAEMLADILIDPRITELKKKHGIGSGEARKIKQLSTELKTQLNQKGVYLVDKQGKILK